MKDPSDHYSKNTNEKRFHKEPNNNDDRILEGLNSLGKDSHYTCDFNNAEPRDDQIATNQKQKGHQDNNDSISNSQYINSQSKNTDLRNRLREINKQAEGIDELSLDEENSQPGQDNVRKDRNQKKQDEGQNIYYDDENNLNESPVIQLLRLTPENKLMINRSAVKLLRSITKKIAVVCVAGPYRTGKSFLLNRFAGRQEGFALGSTTNPCTDGLWIWGEPIPLNDEMVMILVDTEGLNSYNRDEMSDMILFAITCMLSSTLIYNTFGAIDEKAIERLGFIANITQLFNFKEKKINYETEFQLEISKYFPTFHWVLRDFSLDLYDDNLGRRLTPKEYLETALLINTRLDDQHAERNKTRNAIREFFRDRHCTTLIRPVLDEKQLRNIEQMRYNDLKPGFRESVEELQQLVLNNVKPKIIDNVPINGNGYVELVEYLVQAINNKGLPEIQNTWERIVQAEMKSILKNALKIFDNGQNVIEQKLPIEDEELYKSLYRVKVASSLELNKFRYSSDKCNMMRDIFEKRIKNSEEEIISMNQMRSKKVCQEIARQIINKMNVRMNVDESEIGPGFSQAQYQDIRNDYLERAMGSYKYDILMSDVANNFIMTLEQLYDKKNTANIEERNEFEIMARNYEGKYEATKIIQEKQREMSEALMLQSKDNYSDQLKFYEGKIDMMKNNYEDRLSDVRGQMKDITKAEKKETHNKKYINEGLVNFAEIKRLNDNFMTMMEKLKNQADVDNNEKVQNRIDRETNKLEGKFQSDLFKLKKTNDMELDKIKHSYEKEIDVYKENIKRLEMIRQENLSIILQKEAEIRLLQEKIRNEERQKHTKMEQAEMICKVVIFF